MLHNSAARAVSRDPLPLVLTYLNIRSELRCGFYWVSFFEFFFLVVLHFITITNLHIPENLKGAKNGETPWKIDAKQRLGRQMENFFTTYQGINSLIAKSTSYQGTSSSFQRPQQTKQELSNNCWGEILNNSFGGWDSCIFFFTGKPENHILFL